MGRTACRATYAARGDTLAVLAPGLGNGAFSYAPQIQWLAKAGLRVFSFDYTGCYGSTGRSCRGFPQAADDLRAALRFLEENGRFGSHRLVLLGHSMGGYAVCCACREAGWMRPCASAG